MGGRSSIRDASSVPESTHVCVGTGNSSMSSSDVVPVIGGDRSCGTVGAVRRCFRK